MKIMYESVCRFHIKQNDSLVSLDSNKGYGIYGPQPVFKQAASSGWEYKKEKLTYSTIETLHKMFNNLKRTDFAGHVTKKLAFNDCTDTEITNPTNLNTVAEKLKRSSYMYFSEFVHDIRHIMSYANPHSADIKYLMHLVMFKNKFDQLLEEEFPNMDFKYVTRDSKELFLLLQGDGKKTNGGGDH